MYVATQIAANDMPALLDMQVPKYILPKDTFNVTCIGRNHVRMRVYHCQVTKSQLRTPQELENEFYVNLQIVHAKKPCEVQCFSRGEIISKTILVLGKCV